MHQIIEKKEDFNLDLKILPTQPLADKVLMVTPKYFDIETPINAHMLDEHGYPHKLNKRKALQQWDDLKTVYEKLNFSVSIVEGIEALPDMVFCANQSFPYLDKNNNKKAILSNMLNDVRHKEVEYIQSFLTGKSYSTTPIADRYLQHFFEGMGDVLWLNKTKFILGGYGFRTNKRIYHTLSEFTEAPIAIFELKNPKFYHLDTCLSILNSSTALVCKEAFTEQGFQLLQTIFPNLLEVPLFEADSPGFACNAHCPDEKHVILQYGNAETLYKLKSHGFIPIEVDTSEFIKSGGSVFCMKLMFF